MSGQARIALSLGIVALVLASLSVRLYGHWVRAFRPPHWFARAVAAGLGLGWIAGVGSRALSEFSPELARSLGSLGSPVVVGVLLSSALLLPYDALLALAWVWRRRRKRPEAKDERTPPRAESLSSESSGRRRFLSQTAVGGAVSLGMGASFYGTFVGRHDFTLETVPIRLANLPRSLDGLSLVQLSDLHVGLYIGDAEFARAFELVERARPDLVVLTGDLLDHDPRYAPQLGRFVRGLRARAPRGVFAIPGNHDYYAGVAVVEQTLREAGAEVLTNRHTILGDAGGRLVLGGLDDVMAPEHGGDGPRLDRAFVGAPPDLARVLLSHNPSYYPSCFASADLTLSGHTHGGQISLFINPAELVLRHGFVRGHYTHRGSQLYVNRGFGTAGPPARVGSPPEITKLVLMS